MSYSERLIEIGKECFSECATNYDLSKKCTYGTGGRADGYFAPNTEEKLKEIMARLKAEKIPYYVLGGGSDVLVSDEGFRGAIIATEKLKGLSLCGKILTAYAGERVKDVVDYALNNCLGGIEFLSGIPASTGGVTAMNAGCFGKNIAEYIAYVVTTDGVYSTKNCDFEYRSSRFKRDKECIIKTAFALDNVEYEQSESKIEYFAKLRKGKQPKGRTCGSVFRNDGYYAGKLIESCNLKGRSVGKASVSEKHANFIIAAPGATSADIRSLIETVKAEVYAKTGTLLREEIEYIGRFGDENKF